MFNRKVRHTIPDQFQQSKENINETLERNDEESKKKLSSTWISVAMLRNQISM